jgi:hypothetical protein
VATQTATAGGPGGQSQQQQQQRTRHWEWVEILGSGLGGVLQHVSERHPLCGEFSCSFLSCLCSLLKFAGSDERLRVAGGTNPFSMQRVFGV